MLPRKTLTAGIALAAVALIAVPAVALAARQDDSLFAAARASASVTADPPSRPGGRARPRPRRHR
ncbi:hypothetical protein [Nonomuraea rubra]|uniref:hypothetical protein n=1 Tax=Nonomuraea rubra TaxID=46180 RepID=UPI0036240236